MKTMYSNIRHVLARAILAAAFLSASAVAHAQATTKFDLPAQPLADSLRAVASQTHSNILFDRSLVAGLSAKALAAHKPGLDHLASLVGSCQKAVFFQSFGTDQNLAWPADCVSEYARSAWNGRGLIRASVGLDNAPYQSNAFVVLDQGGERLGTDLLCCNK